MAGPNYVLDKGFVAGGAISQYRLVTLAANGVSVSQAAAQGVQCIGVSQETASAGDVTNGRVVAVRLMGISRCVAGAIMATAGVPVTASADGGVEPAAAADLVIGLLLQPAAAIGNHVDVLLYQGGIF